MKLLRIEGCTDDLMEIDGKCMTKYTAKELRNILKYIINNVDDYAIPEIIIDIVEGYSKEQRHDVCGTCGDSINTSILKI